MNIAERPGHCAARSNRSTVESAATVVLVPGAWHSFRCWDRVVDELEHLGIRSWAVDLAAPERGQPAARDLHQDGDRVTKILDVIPAPTVLCGHSYGGMVITEAGHHPRVRTLVYLAAFLPEHGETVADIASQGASSLQVIPEVELDADGLVRMTPASAAAAFYNGCSAPDIEGALEHLLPQPIPTMMQAATRLAWSEKPSIYVVCTEDRAIPPSLQRRMGGRAATVIEWPTGHAPFLSDPGRVARLLAEVAIVAV